MLILAVWAKIREKWLKIRSFDDSIRIFILKWGTFFILMRRYPLYLREPCSTLLKFEVSEKAQNNPKNVLELHILTQNTSGKIPNAKLKQVMATIREE